MEKDTGISEAMLREEERMRKAAEKKQAARDNKMEAERRKDLSAGTEAVDKKFKALEYLLNQSKVSRSAD
jgi:ATP-dependent DNA helicase